MAQDFCAEVGCKLVYGLSAMYGACCVRYDDERTMYGTGHCEGCGAPALNRAAARVGCEYLNLWPAEALSGAKADHISSHLNCRGA